jgi:hypothetical protein
MQLRRERVYFYLSSLLRGKTPISFARVVGEENRDAQCQMRSKNRLALSVGVSLTVAFLLLLTFVLPFVLLF